MRADSPHLFHFRQFVFNFTSFLIKWRASLPVGHLAARHISIPLLTAQLWNQLICRCTFMSSSVHQEESEHSCLPLADVLKLSGLTCAGRGRSTRRYPECFSVSWKTRTDFLFSPPFTHPSHPLTRSTRNGGGLCGVESK